MIFNLKFNNKIHKINRSINILNISLNTNDEVMKTKVLACKVFSTQWIAMTSDIKVYKMALYCTALWQTSPFRKTSGNLQMRYLRRCASNGTLRAVQVRNIHPIRPLLTGALSATQHACQLQLYPLVLPPTIFGFFFCL